MRDFHAFDPFKTKEKKKAPDLNKKSHDGTTSAGSVGTGAIGHVGIKEGYDQAAGSLPGEPPLVHGTISRLSGQHPGMPWCEKAARDTSMLRIATTWAQSIFV